MTLIYFNTETSLLQLFMYNIHAAINESGNRTIVIKYDNSAVADN